MSDRTRTRKTPGGARAGRGRAASGKGSSRPDQKAASRTKAAQRAATLRRRRVRDGAENTEAGAVAAPEAGGTEAAAPVAAETGGRDTLASAPARDPEGASAETSGSHGDSAEGLAATAETGGAVGRDRPSGEEEGGATAGSTAGGSGDGPARGRASRSRRKAKVPADGPEAPERTLGGQPDGRETRSPSRRKTAKNPASAPDQASGGAARGGRRRRSGDGAGADAGAEARKRTRAGAAGTAGSRKAPAAELEKSEEATPAAMPLAAPIPAPAAVPGAASLSDTVSPFGLAAAATPGLGLLPSPGGLPRPRELVAEVAEIAQIGMEANVAAARALTAASTPSDLLESQVRSIQILADAWMRQGARLSELWMRLLPGGR